MENERLFDIVKLLLLLLFKTENKIDYKRSVFNINIIKWKKYGSFYFIITRHNEFEK